MPIRRPLLAYPTGATPGIDVTNPALVNGTLRWAGVATQGNNPNSATSCGFVQLFPYFKVGLGAAGSTNVISTKIDGIIGPSQTSVNGGNNSLNFSGNTTATDASIVIAAIFRAGATVAALQHIFSTGGNAIVIELTAAGAISFGISFGTQVSSGITAVAGKPYFAAASIKTGLWRIVVRELDSGKLYTATSATAIAMPTPTGIVQLLTSASNGNGFGGGVAAAMFSNGWAGTQELVEWAQDPWKFWYPAKDKATLAGISDVLSPQIWM